MGGEVRRQSGSACVADLDAVQTALEAVLKGVPRDICIAALAETLAVALSELFTAGYDARLTLDRLGIYLNARVHTIAESQRAAAELAGRLH